MQPPLDKAGEQIACHEQGSGAHGRLPGNPQQREGQGGAGEAGQDAPDGFVGAEERPSVEPGCSVVQGAGQPVAQGQAGQGRQQVAPEEEAEDLDGGGHW